MTNEEMERTMQFILEHQAQITVNVDRITEKVDQITDKVDQITDKVNQVTDRLNMMATVQLKYEARTGRLEESFLILVKLAQSTYERMDEFDENMNQFSVKMNEFGDKMNVLADAQIHTDENIKKLTAIVGRYYSEDRNGEA